MRFIDFDWHDLFMEGFESALGSMKGHEGDHMDEKYEKWTGIKEFSQSIVLPKCGSDRLREADLQTATSVVRSAGQACATRLALESINNQARLVDAIKFVRVDTEGGEAVTITMTMVTQGETT